MSVITEERLSIELKLLERKREFEIKRDALKRKIEKLQSDLNGLRFELVFDEYEIFRIEKILKEWG